MSVKAKGTILQSGNTADYETATVWTTIARIKSVKAPKKQSPPIDTTVLESEQVEKIPGLTDVGDAEAKIEYTKDKADDLEAMFGVEKAYRIVYPDSGGRLFNGWLSEDGEAEAVNNEILMMEVKFTVTKSEFDDSISLGS